MNHRIGTCLLAFTVLLVSACGGGDEQKPPVVPPVGVRVTIPPDFPAGDRARLEQLALGQTDLPEGFGLAYEDASEAQDGITYLAHYFNYAVWEDLGSPEQITELEVTLTIDIEVNLFDDELTCAALFDQMASMSREQMIEMVESQRHWSAGDSPLVQTAADAYRVPFRDFGDTSIAWQTVEQVSWPGTDFEMSVFDFCVLVKRGQALGMLCMSAVNQAVAAADVEGLVTTLDKRMAQIP